MPLLVTFSASLSAALVFGYLLQRLKVSPVIGYILAGILIGPHTPGFTADRHLASQMAEVGVILLMFGVGTHFHLKDLWSVRKVVLPGALFQLFISILLVVSLCAMSGWGIVPGILIGAAVGVSSTVMVTRVLIDTNQLHTRIGHVAIGWLIVQDILTVFFLVLLPLFVLAGSTLNQKELLTGTLLAMGKIVAMVALTLLLGKYVLPRVFAAVSATKSRELFTLTVLVTVLGISLGAALVFNVSMPLGAFLAGMVVGRSEYSLRATAEALPLRDAFSALFFVSVGMMFQPEVVIHNMAFVASVALVVLVGNSLAALGMNLIVGVPLQASAAIAAVLAQIGEFSFILASQAQALELVPPVTTTILVAVAIITIILNPLVYRLFLVFHKISVRTPVAMGPVEDANLEGHAVIVGYGPIGQKLTSILVSNQIPVIVIELNIETVRKLAAQGIHGVYGDACNIEILKAAMIKDARFLLVTASHVTSVKDLIGLAKELNPSIEIITRAGYVSECAALRASGADRVYASEGEIALSISEDLLLSLGASPEQVDLERQRIRKELLYI